MAKPTLKNSVPDQSKYAEVNTDISQDSIDINTTVTINPVTIDPVTTPVKTEAVSEKKSPLFEKNLDEPNISLDEVEIKPKRKVVSSHDEIKNSYTGGSKIRSGYNKNVIEEIRKSVPHGDDSKFHGGD
jgi:hypothetical protein